MAAACTQFDGAGHLQIATRLLDAENPQLHLRHDIHVTNCGNPTKDAAEVTNPSLLSRNYTLLSCTYVLDGRSIALIGQHPNNPGIYIGKKKPHPFLQAINYEAYYAHNQKDQVSLSLPQLPNHRQLLFRRLKSAMQLRLWFHDE